MSSEDSDLHVEAVDNHPSRKKENSKYDQLSWEYGKYKEEE